MNTDIIKNMPKEKVKELAAYWGNKKLSCKPGKIRISQEDKNELIQIHQAINTYHPEFNYLLDKNSKNRQTESMKLTDKNRKKIKEVKAIVGKIEKLSGNKVVFKEAVDQNKIDKIKASNKYKTKLAQAQIHVNNTNKKLYLIWNEDSGGGIKAYSEPSPYTQEPDFETNYVVLDVVEPNGIQENKKVRKPAKQFSNESKTKKLGEIKRIAEQIEKLSGKKLVFKEAEGEQEVKKKLSELLLGIEDGSLQQIVRQIIFSSSQVNWKKAAKIIEFEKGLSDAGFKTTTRPATPEDKHNPYPFKNSPYNESKKTGNKNGLKL